MSIRDIQKTVRDWSLDNFPPEDVGGAVGWQTMGAVMKLVRSVAECSHKVLKAEQSIRGGLDNLNKLNGRSMAGQVANVINYVRRDYGHHRKSKHLGEGHSPVDGVETEWQHKLLGVVEECGELVEAIDKGDDAEVRDALGDIFIFLCDLASALDVDLESAIEEALDEVLDRNWNGESWSNKEIEEVTA